MISVAAGVLAVAGAQATTIATTVPGVDVSSFTGTVDWAAAKAGGAQFAYVKATESTTYTNPLFTAQYGGAAQAGLIHGAYHFAQPHESTGAAQADYFVDHGGAWTANSATLPGALDIENNPYTSINHRNTCYSLTPAQLVTWIGDFSTRYLKRTGRRPAIYTNTAWWKLCTGSSTAFGSQPLWLANIAATVGTLPAGWTAQTIWQYASSGTLPGDQDTFNGTLAQLQALAAQAPKLRTAFYGYTIGPNPVRKGATLTVGGRLIRQLDVWNGLAGQRVSFYFRPLGSSTWTYMGATTTATWGVIHTTFKASRSGTWQARYWGGPSYLSVLSGGIYIRVR